MRFKMHRNRTISSTCGLSIEFVKNEFHLVPPAMYAEVIAAGGVPEDELNEDELPKAPTAEAEAARKAELFALFAKIAKRNVATEFTAGGMPHLGILNATMDPPVTAKERDAAWTEFQAGAGD